MRSVAKRLALLLLLLVAGVRFQITPADASDTPSTQKVIAITAKRFGFTPDHITLKKGEQVMLRFNSEDVTHGFFIRELKLDEILEPGKTVEVQVLPKNTGEFTAICHHFCGAGHGNMKMSVTVVE